MKPITQYLKDFFAFKRTLGNDTELIGMVKADALLNTLITEQKVPGIAVTVLKEGKTILQKGYGYADLTQEIHVDPINTCFRIASVSKPIAATALAKMVADGRIDLEASFYDYVPYYPKKKYDFTLRQLASHTAGIRGYQGTEYGLNKPYSIKEGIAIFKDDELLFKPGTDYLYNSFDWVLLSLAMQEVSGIPFEDYVYENVLQPLQMTHTMAEGGNRNDEITQNEDADLRPPNRAKFYSKNRRGFRDAIPVNNTYKLAGGGYLSTTADIAKFGQAVLEGNILDKTLMEPFLTSQTIGQTKTYYGLGWQVSEDAKGRPFYGHIGNGVGGYSNFFVYPKQQLVIAILINCTNPNVQEELDAVIDALCLPDDSV